MTTIASQTCAGCKHVESLSQLRSRQSISPVEVGSLIRGAALLVGLDIERGLRLPYMQDHGHGLLGRGLCGAALPLGSTPQKVISHETKVD